MLLAYVDESYNKARYWIAALVCPEAVLNPLTAALDDVVEKAAKAYGVAQTPSFTGTSCSTASASGLL